MTKNSFDYKIFKCDTNIEKKKIGYNVIKKKNKNIFNFIVNSVIVRSICYTLKVICAKKKHEITKQ
jgi:hypothetical protein